MCPSVTQISKMSSSITEVASNGVPYFCININMHFLALRVGSSVGTGSLPEAVAEDEVDIFGFKLKVTMMLFSFGMQENPVSCHNSPI